MQRGDLETISIFRPAVDAPERAGVLALGRSAKATVGFLPDEAFDDRIRQGTLLVALVGDQLAGYALYDLPRDEVRLGHLVVGSTWRSAGIARQLVDRLISDHADRRGIFLSCRNDFPANSMWPHLDFIPVSERKGRNAEGKLLTRWYRSFGQPDLFTALMEEDSRPIATMDACVFFDLVSPHPTAAAEWLRADWLDEHVRIAVTPFLSVEIHEGKDPGERARQLAAQAPFELPPAQPAVWRPILDQLLKSNPDSPDKDRGDLTHAAQSIAAGATWLISDDGPFRSRYGETAASIGGLQLVSPARFVREVDELARGERYRPVDLAGTSVTRRELDGAGLRKTADLFVNHRAGEELREFRDYVGRLGGHSPDVHLQVIEVDGLARGLVAWEPVLNALEVHLLRATTGHGGPTIGRHLLALLRDEALAAGRETIKVTDAAPSATVARSFRDEGFATNGDHLVVAHVLQGAATFTQLQARVVKLGSPFIFQDPSPDNPADLAKQAAGAERWFAPTRVLETDIPNFFVPIRHGWATQLLDIGLAQEQLLPRGWGLGLRRDLVYYRRPTHRHVLKTPARLVWYVSGEAQGAGTIRAVSHLTGVVIDTPEHLMQRFSPLGIYKIHDVESVADKAGNAMALRFTSTVGLPYPVSLDTYREIMTGDPKSKNLLLQSVHTIPEHVFVQLLEQGAFGVA